MWGLVVTAGLGAAAGFLLLANAMTILRPERERFAAIHVSYGIGWAALGLILIGDGARAALGLSATPSVPLYTVLVWLKIVLNAAVIAGFGTYILFAWSGRLWSLPAAVGLGVVHLLFWMATTTQAMSGTIHVGQWGTRMEFASIGIPGGAALGAFMFFVPLLAIAIAYVAFWPHLPRPGQRFRHLMVAVSLIGFLITSSIQANPEVDPDRPTLAINMAVAFAAAVVSRFAFRPPVVLQERGIEGYAA